MSRVPSKMTPLKSELAEFLHCRGVPYRQIAPLLGVHPNSLTHYLDPDAQDRYRARLLAQAAEELAEAGEAA